MINIIISKIEEELSKRGMSETALAKQIDVDQNKVWRFLTGKTKRPDVDLINKIQIALGIDLLPTQTVSEPKAPYSAEEKEIIELLKDHPLIKLSILEMAKLPEDRQYEEYKKLKEEVKKGQHLPTPGEN